MLRSRAMFGAESSFPTQLERPSFEPGQVLAERFEILRFLAAGGVGEVYEAIDRELGERVALKVLRPESAGRERDLLRFRREVQLARKVTHPNVCRLFEFLHGVEAEAGRAEPFSLVVMELLTGETLGARLDRIGAMTPEETLPIVRQIAGALEAAHRVGIIHRDLKSSNIVLVPGPQGERAVVTDFGLARIEAVSGETPSVAATQTGELSGTPAYMAPEQLEGRPVTPTVDVYALGILTYRMLTGRFPFEGPTPLAVAFERLRKEPRPPRELLPELPVCWEQAILRALAREPRERFGSALGFIDAIEGKLGAGKETSGRRLAWGWVALVALALVAVGVLIWRPWHAPDPVSTRSAPRAVVMLGITSPQGAPELAWLGPALTEMLTSELAESGLRLVSDHDPALPEGALLASGRCSTSGEQLRLEMRIEHAGSRQVLVEVVAIAERDDVLTLVERAGEQLRAQLRSEPGRDAPGTR